MKCLNPLYKILIITDKLQEKIQKSAGKEVAYQAIWLYLFRENSQ